MRKAKEQSVSKMLKCERLNALPDEKLTYKVEVSDEDSGTVTANQSAVKRAIVRSKNQAVKEERERIKAEKMKQESEDEEESEETQDNSSEKSKQNQNPR